MATNEEETPTTINQVQETIEKYFPEIWEETKQCLALMATMKIKDINNPLGLILIGAPSSEKTTILSFFYGHDMIFKTDNFTPHAFVSHSANMSDEKLAQIDLLPKIQNKCMVSPELAPLFGKEKEELIESLAILTRVFDGEGFESDSGSKGHRGYSGEYLFTFLGATTPLSKTAWNVMGNLGCRWLFLKMKKKHNTEDKLCHEFCEEIPYKKKVQECKAITHKFLDTLFPKLFDGSIMLNTEDWNRKNDSEMMRYIIRTAQLIRLLRAPVSVWKERGETGSGNSLYEFSTPIPEEPKRLISLLYNLARGHAIIHGRNYLEKSDIEAIYWVGFSSMPYDRTEFFEALLRHEGVIETGQIEKELGCSWDTARKVMKTFAILGVVEESEDGSGFGRPESAVGLRKEFGWVFNELKKA